VSAWIWVGVAVAVVVAVCGWLWLSKFIESPEFGSWCAKPVQAANLGDVLWLLFAAALFFGALARSVSSVRVRP
jgi:hypothetical protein